ncbi:hypothetical protein RIB2604_00604470 [Aspergillus luchuensis]|uniref:Uncharacterized protein n=1 Tax=Aspergillus kawachii TaxID=1069201 RepID=A0A146F0Q8_ASPKA|nr:hypothetical protein RIB2604_00604470 [Aspergillus luchuensis]
MDFHLVPRGEDRNYTGFLTKTIVYTASLINDECHGDNRYFCSMWRSVGFLMSFAIVLEGMTVVAYLIVLSGGKRLRESGWKIVSLLIILSAAVQAASMSLVAYLVDNEDRFASGWVLDESWIFCTVSWCVSLFVAGVLILAGTTLPSEGGYELIPDQIN